MRLTERTRKLIPSSSAMRLNRDEVIQIWKLGGCEDFVSERSLYSMRWVIWSQ